MLKREFYKLSNDIYAALIKKVFSHEFCFWRNMPIDFAISLNQTKKMYILFDFFTK